MKKLYLPICFLFILQINAVAQSGWNEIYNFHKNIKGIAFKDSLNGYVMPSAVCSFLYKTTDGGKTWKDQNIPGFKGWISTILFIKSNFYIGVGYAGNIIISTDGGNSWDVKYIGDKWDLGSVCYTEDGKLFAISTDSNKVYRSTNMGNTWTRKLTSAICLRDIAFPSNNIGFGVGIRSTMIKTTDGGESWFNVTPALPPSMLEIKFIDENVGYILGNWAQIVKTTDGGVTWNLLPSLNSEIDYIATWGDKVIYAFSDYYILKSTDAGQTWSKQSFTPSDRIVVSAATCVSQSTAYAISGVEVYKTTDGGWSAPSLNSPANNIAGLPLTLSLTWYSLNKGNAFRVQVSTDNDFNNIVKDTIVAGNSFVAGGSVHLSKLELNTKYYWRVYEKFGNTNGPWSLPWNFTTTDGAPDLILPSNNSFDIPLTTTLSWKDVTLSAGSYQLQISTDSSFKNLFLNDSTITVSKMDVNRLSDSTRYYWRVRAKVNNTYGAWSEVWNFLTMTKTPRLISPVNNLTGSGINVSLKWTMAAETTGYRVQVVKDSLFYNLDVDTSDINNTSYNVKLNYSTKYFWRIGAENVNGQTYWSNYWSFTTNRAPKAKFPLEVGNKWYYQAGSNKQGYYYGVVKEITDTLSDGFRVITSNYYYRDSKSTKTEYWGYINGKFYNGHQMDTYIYDDYLTKDTSISGGPSYMSRDLIPYSIFNVTDTAQQYFESYYHMGSGGSEYSIVLPNIGIVKTYNSSLNGYNFTTTDDSTYLIGIYRNGELLGDTVFTNYYKISNPVSPANGAIYIPDSVELKWNKAFEAISYTIQVSTDSNFSSIDFNYPGLTDTSKVVEPLKYATKYFWRVETYSSDGNKYLSHVFTFTTVDLSSVSVPLIPLNNSKELPLTIEFKWKDAKTTGHYEIQISTDSLFKLLYYDYGTIDTSFTVNSLNYSQTYYWRIITISNGYKFNSQFFRFTTINMPLMANPVFPKNNSAEIPKTTQLMWTKVPDAIYYEVQISDDLPFFNNIKFDFKNLTDTTKRIDSLGYAVKYYWRVSTIRKTNEFWSPIWSFTTVIFPTKYQLYQNYPNPFNPVTKIRYDLPEAGHVTLKIYDILGREITTLVNTEKPAGSYEVEFNGSKYPSGIYFYQIQAGSYTSVKKMILIK